MKKIFSSVMFFLIFGAVLFVSAQSAPIQDNKIVMPMPPVSTQSASADLLFGQEHYYSVYLRGNGEAIVTARIVLSNTSDTILENITFLNNYININDITAYQIILPPRCIRYDYSTYSQCVEFGEPDYSQQYYDGYNSTRPHYQKLIINQIGTGFKVNLKTDIETNKSGTILLSYSIKNLASQSLGLLTFNFETLKVSTRIHTIKVAVNVDTDYILKGGQSQVNYEENINTISAVRDAAENGSFSNNQIDNYIWNIGSSGMMTKSSSNLAANESLSVYGEYSKSSLRLYTAEIIFVILIIFSIFLIVYIVNRKSLKRIKTESEIKKEIPSNMKQLVTTSNFFSLWNVGMGFLSVLSTGLLTAIIDLISKSGILNNLSSYYYGYNTISIITYLFIIIVFIILYLVTTLGPAIFTGIKRGWKNMFGVILFELLWFILTIILISALFSTGIIRINPYAVPALEKTITN